MNITRTTYRLVEGNKPKSSLSLIVFLLFILLLLIFIIRYLVDDDPHKSITKPLSELGKMASAEISPEEESTYLGLVQEEDEYIPLDEIQEDLQKKDGSQEEEQTKLSKSKNPEESIYSRYPYIEYEDPVIPGKRFDKIRY